MNEHYDAALLGIWWGSNYGSCLNGYAVYKVLKSLGLSVLLVNKHNASENDWELSGTHNGRFMQKFYPPEEVSPVIPFPRLHELNDIVDTFITGSDQIWNYNINSKFDMVFLQNFVADGKRQISFATSFGHDFDKTPPQMLPECIRLMNRYNAISVREKSGVGICREVYGVDAQVVLEPVFLLDRSKYEELASRSEIPDEETPYILTYILDPTPAKRKAVQYYSEVSGIRAVNVLDGNHANYDRNCGNLNLPNTMGKIGAEDLMKLFMNASFVLSDSFHGAAFAIIFNKPFLSVMNKGRGAARFGELLGRFGLTDRLVSDPGSIPEDPRFFEEIDYTDINVKIKQEAEKSIKWLEDAIKTPLEEMPTVSIASNAVTIALDKRMCVGCGACVSVCPKDALKLVNDKDGFYRSAIDYSKCVNCGLCKSVCPALELPENKNHRPEECCEFVSSSDEVLRRSSSGGAFTAMAEKILSEGGVVFGAAWRDDLTVEHIMISSMDELYRLQKSKYVQSYMGSVYRQVKEQLEKGVPVLFTGCPCQAAGLKKYLGRDYDKLIIVDLLCSYAPPAPVFKKYINDQFTGGLSSYEFRHKTEGWNWDCMTVKMTGRNGDELVRHGTAEDPFQKAYHTHLMTGYHCENCLYQKEVRIGDITIGDFWGIGKKDPEVPTQKGVSAVICSSEKGKRFFDSIDEAAAGFKKSVTTEFVGNNGFMVKGTNYAHKKRDEFYELIGSMSFADAVKSAINDEAAYAAKMNPIQFSSRQSHFVFDRNVWEEHNIHGMTTLTVAEGMAKAGRYAYLQLYAPLLPGRLYSFRIRFKAKTMSNYINFHIYNTKLNKYQIIHTHRVFGGSDDWIEVTREFRPNDEGYDSFMIGASQFFGDPNYFILDSVNMIRKR